VRFGWDCIAYIGNCSGCRSVGMQNTTPLTISFLFGVFRISSSDFGYSMLLGVILGVLLVMPSFNARGRTVKNLRDEIKQLQDEKSKLQEDLNLTKDLLKQLGLKPKPTMRTNRKEKVNQSKAVVYNIKEMLLTLN